MAGLLTQQPLECAPAHRWQVRYDVVAGIAPTPGDDSFTRTG